MHLLVPFEMELIVVVGAELGREIILLPGLRQVGIQPCAKVTAKRLGLFAVVEIHRILQVATLDRERSACAAIEAHYGEQTRFSSVAQAYRGRRGIEFAA